jgi:hypothetical protein
MNNPAPPVMPMPAPRNGVKLVPCVLAIVAGVAVLLLLHYFPPGQVPIYPVCPMKQSTGLDCPGCGGLRAMHQLTNGDLAAAWRLNPFVFLFVPLMAYEVIVRGILKRPERGLLARSRVLITLGLFLLAFTLVRNLPLLSQWFSKHS